MLVFTVRFCTLFVEDHICKSSHVICNFIIQDLLKVVDLTTQTIREGGKVLVSCLSGRGRSGTFSALVIGMNLCKLITL